MTRAVLTRYLLNALPGEHDVLSALGISGQSFSYLVATAGQERLRRNYAEQANQVVNGKSQLVFDRAIRLFLSESSFTLSARPDEWIAIRRAINASIIDPERIHQLNHDTVALRDALAELEVYGIDLASGDNPPFPFVHPELGQILQALQIPFRSELMPSTLFEEAAYRYISTDYKPKPNIIMEGFTFLTPLQRHFVDQCLQKGSSVFFLYPYRNEQIAGFAIMLRTYERYHSAGASIRDLPEAESIAQTDLAVLQRSLFSEGLPNDVFYDNTVRTRVFSHRHREVAACIRDVLKLISEYKTNGLTPGYEHIAIVVRDAETFHSLLQEEAELQDADLKLSVRPRLLLLTPVGRFVLTLYQIWKDDALNLDDEQFEAILTSGWLGAQVQVTSERFRKVKAEMFARCRTKEEWQSGFARLKQRQQFLRADSRQAVIGVSGDTVRLWEEALEQINMLCGRLFSAAEGSIGEHVRRLKEELDQFAPEDMYKAERDIVEGIQQALIQMSEATSLEIKPGEFGDVLPGLVREYERAADEASKEKLPESDTIWVTTPEGIDGTTCEHVILLGADNQHMPRNYMDPWPFFHNQLENHLELERYFFLATIRAATHSFSISYAQADETDIYRPSPYLNEIRTLLQRPLEEEEIPSLPEGVTDAAPAPFVSAQRDEYTLDEIAHFALCPFRYKLERLDGRARQYQDAFQVRLLAQGVWIERILRILVEKGNTGSLPTAMKAVRTQLDQIIRETKLSIKADYPGFDSLDWDPIIKQVRAWRGFILKIYETQSNKHPTPFQVRYAEPSRFTIIADERSIVVRAPISYVLQVGDIKTPILDDRMREEWLLTSQKGTGVNGNIDDIPVFSDLGSAVGWWISGLRAAYHRQHTSGQNAARDEQKRQAYIQYQEDIRTKIEFLELGHYPKHIGDHCKYCPVRHTCLGCE